VQHFGRFFHKKNYKSAPAYGKKGFYTNYEMNMQEVGFIVMKRLRTLKSSQILKTQMEKSKTIAVDVFFKAYPMVPGTTLMHIQSVQTVP
jgi:hypothetical protein